MFSDNALLRETECSKLFKILHLILLYIKYILRSIIQILLQAIYTFSDIIIIISYIIISDIIIIGYIIMYKIIIIFSYIIG